MRYSRLATAVVGAAGSLTTETGVARPRPVNRLVNRGVIPRILHAGIRNRNTAIVDLLEINCVRNPGPAGHLEPQHHSGMMGWFDGPVLRDLADRTDRGTTFGI